MVLASLDVMRPSTAAPALLLALGLSLTGCGNEMQADTNENSAAGRAPACSDVWSEGTAVPADYTGCEEAGSLQPLVATDCGDGSQLTTFGDEYFAVLGETVQVGGPDSEAYAAASAACQDA